MNKVKLWYVLLTLSFFYQVSFLFSYFTEHLVELNLVVARAYWITAGLFGVIIGAYIMFKGNIGSLAKILAFIVMVIGIGLIGLWLFALAITSM
ncbi:hypothetical protein [Bacillus sp. FJAT-27445]|uniref:hypothetical protein n=1 Tax=Bacillus sp. FJAT-27445 TaxID=1679166 RepID=UPI000743F0DF|nr:hypothetical protein [Bacillus sp. FJAT-27445]